MSRYLLPLALLAATTLATPQTATAEPRPPDCIRIPTITVQPTVSPGVVEQVGEIVVMEGDDEIVSTIGPGEYGIELMENISNRFYLQYPDDFDGIAVFTTFPDQLQSGAAYALILNSVGGLGYPGNGAVAPYGSAGRLMSLMNINDVNNYGTMTEEDNWFATVIGHEFGHSWLAFVQFQDPVTSQASSELLGRDGSHWSAIFASGSSVMDGVDFTDNGDGTFTAGPYSSHYAPLDLYAMGVYAPEEVGDLFIVRNARYQDTNEAVNPVDDGWTGQMSQGRVIVGDRVDFTIDDIVAVHGPRVPAWDEENEDFRIAFVLVTKPGESVEDVAEQISRLEVGRLTFEQKHREWTDNRSTLCTDITAPCPLAFAAIDTISVAEDSDDSDEDGVIEPGERVRVDVTYVNEGREAATTALAELTSTAAGVDLPEPEQLPEIPIEGSIEHPFFLEISSEACGRPIDLEVRTTIETRTWKRSTSFVAGVVAHETESFATPAGWEANKTGSDTAATGAWEHGIPEATFFAGRTLQPDGGAGGPDDPAWFTGPFDAWDDGEVTGATTLTSATYDFSELYKPTLRYKVWYLAYDRPPGTLVAADEAHLTVEASDDGGETWVEIDSVSGDPVRWVTREVPLADVIDTTANVLFRFTAFDDLGADQRLVEVGIDDVSIVSLSGDCRPGAGGGGCCSATTSTRELWGVAFLVIFVLGTALNAPRRRRATRRSRGDGRRSARCPRDPGARGARGRLRGHETFR